MSDPSAEALGAVLRRQRRERNLKQADVAARASISAAYLSQLEHGLRHPSDQTLAALGEVFGTSPSALRTKAAELIEAPRSPGRSDEAVFGWAELDVLEATLRDHERLKELALAATEKAEAHEDSDTNRLPSSVYDLARLLLAFTRGDYRALRHVDLYVITAALLYVVVPDDTVPDYVTDGRRDDAAVVTFATGLTHPTLVDFAAWERRQT